MEEKHTRNGHLWHILKTPLNNWLDILSNLNAVHQLNRYATELHLKRRDLLGARLLLFLFSRILGDPGAVSRAGLIGATKVFKYRRKSPWVPTLTGPFPNGQENAGSWLGTKNALYYCAQSANSFSWVLFVSSYTTAIISPQLPGSFTKLS